MTTEMTTGWRSVEVLHGDTLQDICAREMGDPARWVELAWINKLVPPYLTGDPLDPRVANGTMALYGARIRVPVAGSIRPGTTAVEAFGVDVSLGNGELMADDGGDILLVSGVPNLKQALSMRLNNPRGSLLFHQRYGNEAKRLIGRKLSPAAALIVQRFCEETVMNDPRVTSMSNASVSVRGDAVAVDITAEVDGFTPLHLQITL